MSSVPPLGDPDLPVRSPKLVRTVGLCRGSVHRDSGEGDARLTYELQLLWQCTAGSNLYVSWIVSEALFPVSSDRKSNSSPGDKLSIVT